MSTTQYTQSIQQLYVAYFGRPADTLGLQFWESTMAGNGGNLAVISSDFSKSPEYTAVLEGKDAFTVVDTIYMNLFGRHAEYDGLVYWAGHYAAGRLTISNIIEAVSTAAVGSDLVAYNNKATAATAFTEALDTAAELIAYNAASLPTVKAFIAGVTDDATLAAAIDPAAMDTLTATVVQVGTPVPPFSTFTLTTSADSGSAVAGTTGGDMYIATISNLAAGTTLGAGDVLSGATGNDTLSISVSGSNAGADTNTTAVTLSSIETISVSNFQTDDTANTNIDLSQATGVTTLAVNASSASGDTFFTAVRNIVAAEMGNGSGDLGVTYADSVVTGTADAQSLTLKGQTGGTFKVGASTGGVETLNVVSSSSANTVMLSDTNATIKTINISGDQALTLTEGASIASNVTVIDANTATGAVKVTTSAAQDLSITGGSANDTITFSADNFTAADTINGGAGTDTLSVAGASYTAATFAKVTNVETVALTAAATITLASNISATTIDLSNAAAQTLVMAAGYTAATTAKISTLDTITNSVANVALTVEGTDAAFQGSTVTGGTGADTLKITAATQGGTAVTFTAGGHVTGVETVTIVDGGDASATKGRDISLTLGNYGTALSIDGSALDAGTGVDDETLTVDGTSFTKVLTLTGGAGNDTVTGGTAADIINTGAGDDSINGAQGGNDSINAGAGNDTINMNGSLTSGDTIDGGAGNDTLLVSGISASALTNVTNVETLALSGGGSATLTSNLSFTTVDLSSGATAETLTLSTGYTAATTVTVDAGDKVVNDANVALTVKANASELAATTITGGTGTDSLTVTIDAAAPTVTFDSLITGVEAITIVDRGDATATAGSDITLNLGSYATAVSIDGSALDVADSLATDTTAEILTVNGGSATKAITITTGAGGSVLTTGSGNDVLVGGSGVDSITSGTGNDSLNGGSGNDVFVLGANLTYQDTIIGGSGADTLSISSASATVNDVDFMQVSGVETVTISAYTNAITLGSYASAAGVTTVSDETGGGVSVTASGMATGITINAVGGNDTLTGGIGNDTFVFFGSNLDASDVLNGTSGVDTISLRNTTTATNDVGGATSATIGDIANIDQIVVNDAATSGTGTVSVTLAAGYGSTAGNGQQDLTLAIDGSALDSGETFTVNASANVAAEKVSITGGAAADTLTGGAGNDIIVGGAGADSITGGVGADVLTGGDGADTFNYALASSQSTNALTDTISDFVSGTDAIVINYTTSTSTNTTDFTNKGTAASSAEGLSLLSGTSVATRIGQYFYNSGTKQLVVDADGNGLIQSTDMFVTLTGSTTLADVNFNITAGGTQVSTITTGGGNDTITASTAADVIASGAGNDTVDILAAANHTVDLGAGNDTILATQANLDASDSLTGGSGTDTLSIAGTGTSTLTTDANLVGIENITFSTDSHALVLTNQTEAFNITFANGTNSVTMAAGALAHTVTGGTGADTVTYATQADFTAHGSLVGAAGADILAVAAASTAFVDADFARMSGFETLQLGGAANTVVLGSNATTAGISTIIAGTGATSITSTETANTVTATSVAGTLTLAGSSNYTVTTGTATDVTATGHTGTLAVTLGNDAGNAVAFVAGNGNTTVTGVDAADVVTVTGLATEGQTFTGSVSKFAITAGANAQTIVTGAASDTIDGAAGNDTITAGAGADSITGGANSDTIIWTATTTAAMATEAGVAAGDNDFGAGTAGDTVVGFTTAADVLKFSALLTVNATGVETDTLLSIATGGTVTNTARFVEVTTALADGTTGTAITALDGLVTSAVAIGDSFIAFVNDGVDGYLYLVTQVSTSNTIAAQDVQLIGQLTGVTDIASGDLVSF
ncbi:hypothetical protein LJR289_005817 [Pseudoduganella sp. LjRoot289]|uniref:beta strand repeat-containing protein n=1 Tax=Pseudoduganella sp. LjRoot289 TaxID=3342314 RepID=UPI003ECE25F6